MLEEGRRETDPILEISHIHKRFSGLVVLSDVNFSLAEGEILGLIGPNGAGKTTLFNIISGVLKPDRGRVFFGGRNITGKAPHKVSRMGIARTFQIPQPFPEMTVLENVGAASMFSHGGGNGRLPKDPAEICNLLGFGGKMHEMAKRLTGGEKKRLEVARALGTSPRLILLDEFAAGLTVAETQWASEMIRKLSKEFGLTLVWTEHVMRVLMRTVDRVVVLHHGAVIAEGAPEMVVKDQSVLEAYFGGSA